MLLYQILQFLFIEKYKKVIQNKFKISVPMWNDKYELSDRSILCQIFKIILSIFKNNMEKRLIILQ